MNHTGVNISGLYQSVKDEVGSILDAVEIGTDDEFIVCDTEVITQHEFESIGFFRVPCAVGRAYVKQYRSRNHHKIYKIAYESEIDGNGNSRPPFYRVIKLKSQLSYTHPSGNAFYTFTVDSSTNSVRVDNGNSAYTLPMSNMLDTTIDAISYHENSPRRNYDYMYGESSYVRSATTDAWHNSWTCEGTRSLR